MTNFEIAMLLVLIVYGIICVGLFSRTRRNKSCIEITNNILDCHNMRIDGIIDRIDNLVKIVGDYMDETHELLKAKNLRFLQSKNNEADKKIGVGKWIRIESDGTDGTCYWYACSACHNKVPKSQYGTDYFSPYCPACGAKMEFESEVSWTHE